MRGTRTHSREQPEDQKIRRLERRDRNVVQILFAIHHVAADHRPELIDGNPEFFGGLNFGVLRLPRSSELRLEHYASWLPFSCIVVCAAHPPNQAESLFALRYRLTYFCTTKVHKST